MDALLIEKKEEETEQAGQTDTISKTIRTGHIEFADHKNSFLSRFMTCYSFMIGLLIFAFSQIGLGIIGMASCFCMIGCKSISRILMSLSPLLQALAIVIYLLVADVYPEIQSWHIAYLTWAAVCTALGLYQLKIGDGPNDNACTALFKFLRFFDIKAEDFEVNIKRKAGLVEVCLWSIVPLYPALIAGLIANWILQDRYALECDVKYDVNGECAVVEDGVCCNLEFLTVDIASMFGILGGNILFGYHVTKYIVISILVHG